VILRKLLSSSLLLALGLMLVRCASGLDPKNFVPDSRPNPPVAPEASGWGPVDPRLRLRPAFRSDSRIREELLQLLASDPDLDVFQYRVSVADGRATVTTDSPLTNLSDAEQARLRTLASRVTRDYEIAPAQSPPRDPESEGEVPSDAGLRRKIIDRMLADPSVPLPLVSVTVRGRVVRLSGSVPYLESKHRAETSVSEVPGVSRVENEIRVRKSLHSDSTLTRNISAALTQDPYFDPSAVRISVRRGVVELKGLVENLDEKRKILSVVSKIRGVTDVHDRLTTL